MVYLTEWNNDTSLFSFQYQHLRRTRAIIGPSDPSAAGSTDDSGKPKQLSWRELRKQEREEKRQRRRERQNAKRKEK